MSKGGNVKRLWVDDWRDPPDDSWLVVRTYRDAFRRLFETGEEWDEVALDNDLGSWTWGEEGQFLLRRLVDREREDPSRRCPEITILTANPVAEDDMRRSLGVLARVRSAAGDTDARP